MLVALAPSRVGGWLLALMVISTLAVILATPGLAWARILVATWVICAGLEALHSKLLHRGARGVRTILLKREREIQLLTDDGRWVRGAVRDGCFVAPWLTVVRWRAPTHRRDRALLLLPDMLPREDFRRLRVLLRWL